MLRFIEALRAVAVALIVNSHLKGVYPTDALSFGAGMGLAIFYMISGYLLANVETVEDMRGWYWKKVIRLYIPLWIYQVLMIAVGYQTISTVENFIKIFVFPGFWFTASMLVFYNLYGIFVRKIYRVYGEKAIHIGLLFLIVVFMILYRTKAPIAAFDLRTLSFSEFGLETYSFLMQWVWFACMLLGFLIRKKSEAMPLQGNGRKCLGVSAVFFFLNVGWKVIAKNPAFDVLCFLPAVCSVGFAYFLFQCFMHCERLFYRMSFGRSWKLVGIVSGCSLEIYYVQFFWIDLLKGIPFPVNALAICAAIVLSGAMLHKISASILQKSGISQISTRSRLLGLLPAKRNDEIE